MSSYFVAYNMKTNIVDDIDRQLLCQEKNGIFCGKLDRGVDDDLDDGDDEDEVTDNNAIIGGGVVQECV